MLRGRKGRSEKKTVLTRKIADVGRFSHWPFHLPTCSVNKERHLPLNDNYVLCSGSYGPVATAVVSTAYKVSC